MRLHLLLANVWASDKGHFEKCHLNFFIGKIVDINYLEVYAEHAAGQLLPTHVS